MAYYDALDSVRSYNTFKGVGTLVLIVIIAILALAGRFGGTTPPEVAVVTMVPTQSLKMVETPVDTATVMPTVEAPKVVAPTLALSEVDADGAVTLRGTGTPGSIVELWADGERLDQVTVGDDGTWSFDATFDPGEYDVSVRAVDAGGALLAESKTATVVVEAPKVAAPTLVLSEVNADGAVTLRGTGTPGSTVELWANGKRIEQVTVGDDGTWSFGATFDPGEYDVSVRAVDAGGTLLAESEPVTLVVEAPKVAAPAFTSPAGGETITGGTVELAGTGQPGAKIEILDQGEVVGTVTVQDDGTWAYTYAVEPGTHELAVRNVGDDASTSAVMRIDVVAETTEPAGEVALSEEDGDFATVEVDCSLGDAPEGIDRGDTYIVAPCEYMGLIAARAGVTLKDLIAANPDVEDPTLIFPGQVLNLPPR